MRHTVGIMFDLSRRSLFQFSRTGLLTAAAVLTAAGCSSEAKPKPSASPTASSASPTPSPTPTPSLAVAGADPELAQVVAAHYGGKVTGEAKTSLGGWRGEHLAAVTFGDDVTLAVKKDAWRIVGGWWPSIGQPEPQLGGKPRFVLVIGSDARPGEDQMRARADSIHVLGIDGAGGGGVLGMARDLWSPMPNGRMAKINAALSLGGPEAMFAAVKSVTGLPIEGYVLTGFQGFTTMIDEWGGLPIHVPTQVTEMGNLVIPAGDNHFEGAAALDYARLRHDLPDGDFGRSIHQGHMVLAAAVKARLGGVGTLPGGLAIADQHVASDLSAEQVLTYAAAFFRLDPTAVSQHVVKGPFGTSPDGQSIVMLGDESRAVLAQFASGRL